MTSASIVSLEAACKGAKTYDFVARGKKEAKP